MGQIAFAPDTSRVYRLLAASTQATSLSQLQGAGVADGWFYDSATGSLYLKLTLPTRSAAPGNNAVFTGVERVLQVEY